MEGLTSVFGMRTGVPPPLKHQLRNFKFYLLYLIVCSSPDKEQNNVGSSGGTERDRTSDPGDAISVLYRSP